MRAGSKRRQRCSNIDHRSHAWRGSTVRMTIAATLGVAWLYSRSTPCVDAAICTCRQSLGGNLRMLAISSSHT